MSADQSALSDVLDIVREMLACSADAVRPEAKFFADLGLSSIDLIVLGDRLEQRYDKPLRFAEALPELARTGIDDVTLAELAAFIDLRLSQIDTGPLESGQLEAGS